MIKGILLAAGAFASYSASDALIKYLGRSVSVFEIGFFVTMFALIPQILSRPREESLRDAFRANNPSLVLFRSVTVLISSALSIYAFTNLPLADAYSLVFLIPMMVTIQSVMINGEKIGWRRWLAVVIGFAGILIAVRPGFRELSWAHLSGIGVAFFGALNITLLRRLTPTEKRITLIGSQVFFVFVAYLVLMLPGFVMPDSTAMLALFVTGLFSGGGHALMFAAAKLTPASFIGPMQYSQIVWAVIYGTLIFAEFPDALTYVGLAIVAASGLFTIMREGMLTGWRRHIPFIRPRPWL